MFVIRVPNQLPSGYGLVATKRVEYRIESEMICIRFDGEMDWRQSRICHCLRSNENDCYICPDSGISAKAYRKAKKKIYLAVDQMKQDGMSDDEIEFVRAFMAVAMCDETFDPTVTAVVSRDKKVNMVCKTIALAIREVKPWAYLGDMQEMFGMT
jgi:hypothetical protein